MYLGDTVTNTNLDALFQELHNTALAIGQAKAANDTADLAALQDHFNAVKAQYLSLSQQADQPTYWQGLLGRIGDLQQTASDIGTAAVTGIEATGYTLPLIVGAVALIYLMPLLRRSKAAA